MNFIADLALMAAGALAMVLILSQFNPDDLTTTYIIGNTIAGVVTAFVLRFFFWHFFPAFRPK